MKTKIFVATVVALTAFGTFANAADNKTTGLVGGAVTGAIVGGPVGAVVGGAVGLTTGAAIDDDHDTRTVVIQKRQPDVIIQQEQPDVIIHDDN